MVLIRQQQSCSFKFNVTDLRKHRLSLLFVYGGSEDWKGSLNYWSVNNFLNYESVLPLPDLKTCDLSSLLSLADICCLGSCLSFVWKDLFCSVSDLRGIMIPLAKPNWAENG